jgi:hypothetical protein
MVEVRLCDLPEPLAAAIHAEGFRVAYHLPERGRYVARHVLSDGRSEEIEYDVALGRCLTVDERRRELPAPSQRGIPGELADLVTTHFIDDETSGLSMRFQAIDPSGACLADVVKPAHVRLRWDGEKLVRQALLRQRFPADYAEWPRERRTAHWATVLHRLRRAHAESGRDEDEIYTLDLVRDLERTDARIRKLLPEILTLVGGLEQTRAEEAIAAFSSRTGIRLGAAARDTGGGADFLRPHPPGKHAMSTQKPEPKPIQQVADEVQEILIRHIETSTEEEDARREAERDARVKGALEKLVAEGKLPPSRAPKP